MENIVTIEWLNQFNGPGAYKDYERAKGVNVTLQFCLGTSNIMKRYGITFSEACWLLMKEGYLIWVVETPLYNMAGDKLWMTKKLTRTKNEAQSLRIAYPTRMQFSSNFFLSPRFKFSSA
jgi:hypothetical protein